MTRSVVSFIIALLISFLALSACSSSGGSENGASCSPECEDGLECRNDMCQCPMGLPDDEICCIDDQDCLRAGTYCNSAHRCVGTGPDGDNVIDGDLVSDGDGDPDQTIDGDFEPDGDPDVCEGEGCIDGDLDVIDGDNEESDTTDTEQETPQNACVYGVEKLMHPELLPFYEESTVTRQVSSRDPEEGDDDEVTQGFEIINGSERVIFHAKNPGCIYRMWFGCSGSSGCLVSGRRMRMYFGGESVASINRTVPEIFADPIYTQEPVNPFIPPLVSKMNESYVSYVPVCWNEELMITVDGLINGYNITYQEIKGCEIENFSMDMDVSELVDLMENHIGEDPKPTDGNPPVTIDNRTLPAGSTLTLLRNVIPENEPGRTLNSIKLSITPYTEDVLNNIWLEIYWDGRDESTDPQVKAPIGLFFGSGFGDNQISNLMFGSDGQGNFYSYWPMPYWGNATINLVNRSETNIQYLAATLDIDYVEYPQNESALFHAHYSEEMPTTYQKDFRALDASGKGRVVGMSMAMSGLTRGAASRATNDFLRGDERFYIESMPFPLVRGTGTDNFFNGNMRFRTDGYMRPLFGLWKDSQYNYAAQRLMIGDSIPFNKAASLRFEHGGENDWNGNYRSVTYHYLSCLEGMTLSDEMDMSISVPSDPRSTASHGFDIHQEIGNVEHTNIPGSYEGEDHMDVTYDTGHAMTTLGNDVGYMVMNFSISPENKGVRLIRKLSHKLKNMEVIRSQDALVYVGNTNDSDDRMKLVGHWYTPGTNSYKPWMQDIFDIPAEYVEGKSAIRVLIEHAGGTEWNAFHFWTYSVLPTDAQSEGPGQVTSFSYEMVGLTPCLSWNPPSQGVLPTYYHIFRHTAQAFDCSEQFRVDTVTTTEWCEPNDLEAETTYMYRILAEDCTGTRGLCSDRFEVKTGLPPVCFEAELDGALDPQSDPSDGYTVRTGNYSGGEAVVFEATAPSNRIILNFLVPYAGKYIADVDFVKGPDMAIVEFRQNGFTKGQEDLYSPQLEVVKVRFDTSLNFSSAGTKAFQFLVVGQNGASSGYHIGLDRVCLVPASVVVDGDVDDEGGN